MIGFRSALMSGQIRRVISTKKLCFAIDFSYWMAWLLASEIVTALSEQNASQALYFKSNSIDTKLHCCLTVHEALCQFVVIHFYIMMQNHQLYSFVLFCSEFASSFLALSSWQTLLHRHSCAVDGQHQFYKCMYYMFRETELLLLCSNAAQPFDYIKWCIL